MKNILSLVLASMLWAPVSEARSGLREAIRLTRDAMVLIRRDERLAAGLLYDARRIVARYPGERDLDDAHYYLRTAEGMALDPRLSYPEKERGVASNGRAAIQSIRLSRAFADEDRPDYGGGGGYSDRFPGACFGGSMCSGDRLVLNLRGRHVSEVEFYAHDRIGDKHKGAVIVYADGADISGYVDIKKDGAFHRFSVNREVRRLEIVAVTRDEVEVTEVTVRY